MSRVNKFGIIITTVGEKMGIRDISIIERDRFIRWMEDDTGIPMLSFDSTWNGEIKKIYVIKRMVCGFETFKEK